VKRLLLLTGILVLAGFVSLTVNIDCRDSGVKAVAARLQIDSFMDALDAYKRDTGRYPFSGEGLDALRAAPSGVSNWQGPYLSRPIPRDPWGRAYGYRFPGAAPEKPEVFISGVR
jgi:general secretion pathway protein G